MILWRLCIAKNYFERSERDGKNTGDEIIYASV